MTRRRNPASRAPTDIDRFVGERVRQLRTDQRMTLQELGADLGISHQQLQKYETGTNRFSAGMLFQTARALGVSVADLFPGGDDNSLAAARAIRTVQQIRRVLEREGV